MIPVEPQPLNTLTTPWGKMVYSDIHGHGLPLIFLHGTGCDASDWDNVIAALPPNLRLITLDFRGHGQSDVPSEIFSLADLADDVLHLIADLGLKNVRLIGHSLGGMVAMDAARRSAKIAGLVLLEGWTSLSAAGNAFDSERFYGGLTQTEIERIQRKSEATRHRFDPDVWEAFWASVQQFDAFAYLETVQIPIREVFGGMGRNQATKQKLRVPDNPNIKWVWIEDAGHYLPHERLVEVAAICTDLFSQCGVLNPAS
jgi:pimeloyl-ACP methyl ester carboxylesterase